MAFIKLAARRSLRDGLRCLDPHEGVYITKAWKAWAAQQCRCEQLAVCGLFPGFGAELYTLCASKPPKHSFCFKSRLFSPAATIIRVCLSLFPRASFRKTKAGIKLHVLLVHTGHIRPFAAVTDANTRESRIARTLELPRGLSWFLTRAMWTITDFTHSTKKHISFVARLKRNVVC